MSRRSPVAMGLALLLAGASCSESGGTARAPAKAAASAQVQVEVDRRVELLSILFRLAGSDEYRMADAGLPYLRAVDAHFASFADHPAVRATRRARDEAGVAFDAPMSLAVYLDDQFRLPSPAPPDLDPRWSQVALDDYLADVRRFAAASHAADFFAGQASYFHRVEDRFRDLLARERPVAWFDDFFGVRARARYWLVPGLLTGPSNYGPHAERPGGRVEFYSIVSLEDTDADGLPRPSHFTAELIVHEMAHSYVNPLVDRHLTELEPAMSRIFPLVADVMRKQAYGSWRIMAYESLVRAVTQRYVRQRHGDQAADRLAREDEGISFYWTGELAGELGDHLDMRRVVAFFDRLAGRYADGIPKPPFRGPINAVFKYEPALVDPSPKATRELAAYIGEVRKTIYPTGGAMPGGGQTLAIRAQVLYGSPATSALVAGLLRDSGWTVDESGVSLAGQRFAGPGLVLIACRPHPRDPRLPVLVYAAARDADIVNANAVFHGPDDWVVARHEPDGRFTIVAKGDFPRARDGSWRLDGPAAR